MKGRNFQLGSKSVVRASVLLLWLGVIIAVSVGLIVGAVETLKDKGAFFPEIALPLIVIVGLIALLATLAIAAATFGLFEISDKGQALGLPAGSVQAVIALSLILIFAVVALYASSSTGSQEFESTGLTAKQLAFIPQEEIVASNIEEGKQTYRIVRSVEDRNLKDINTQLLTTVSTLVIAVAGFYFGSKSVQEGNKSAIAAVGPNRSLTVIEPASPHTRYPKDPPLTVRIQMAPPDAPLRWSVLDDPGGQLARLEDGTFVYRHGKGKTTGSATLYFEQVEDPTVSDSLVVKFGEEQEGDAPAGKPGRKGKKPKKGFGIGRSP